MRLAGSASFSELNDRTPRIIRGDYASWCSFELIYKAARPNIPKGSAAFREKRLVVVVVLVLENLAQWASHAIRDRGSYTWPRETRLHTEMFRQTAFGIALLGTLIFLGPARSGVRYNRVDGRSVETIPFEKFHSRPFYKYMSKVRKIWKS